MNASARGYRPSRTRLIGFTRTKLRKLRLSNGGTRSLWSTQLSRSTTYEKPRASQPSRNGCKMHEPKNPPPLKDDHRALLSMIRNAAVQAHLDTSKFVTQSSRNGADLRTLPMDALHFALSRFVGLLDARLYGAEAPELAPLVPCTATPVCRVCGKTAGASPRLCDACAFAALKARPPEEPAPVVCGKCAAIGTNQPGPPQHSPRCNAQDREP